MTYTATRFATLLVATVLVASWSSVRAQDAVWIGATGNWNAGSNWNINGSDYPDAGFDGAAIINNDGVANVAALISQNSPKVILGNANGASGTLNVNAGGTLNVTLGASPTNDGSFTVGDNGGRGVLNVANGGTLNIAGALTSPTAADATSIISLSGNATVNAGSAFLDNVLQLSGTNTNLNVTGNLVLGLGGIHTWDIAAAGASSKIDVGGNADLGGTLKLRSNGFAPAIGATYTIIQSATADFGELASTSGFSFVDVSEVTLPNAGASFRVDTVAGPSSTVLTQVVLEQRPILRVDRQSGSVAIVNPGSGTSIDFDGYSIRSASGQLVPGNWTSLDDANTPTDTWFEANPSATGLSELNTTGSSSVAAASSINLGNGVFALNAPNAFGQENEDLQFTIGRPNGQLIQGVVEYTGFPNNTLVLNVNPATGAAQLVNPSAFDVAIDSYVISSATGSLNTANGTWLSLDDAGIGGNNWFEANVSDTRIAELKTVGSTALNSNYGTLLGLGSPFDTAGTRDLVFQFALAGEAFLRTGKVVYGALTTGPAALAGDYNDDGVVNAADYTVWRDNLGTSMVLPNETVTPGSVTAEDYNAWRANFGATGAGAVALGGASVPEPTTLLLCGAGCLIGLAVRRLR